MAGFGLLGVLCLPLFAATVSSERFAAVDSKMKWSDANAYCFEVYGTSLATIMSDDEAETVMNLLSGENAWVGLYDVSDEGTWVWASGFECGSDCADLEWWNNGEPKVSRGESWNGCALKRGDASTASTLLADGSCDAWTTSKFICDGVDVTSKGGDFVAHNVKMNWDDASEHCEDQGLYLASIHSDKELSAARAACQDMCWLGGKRESMSASWTDGSSWDWAGQNIYIGVNPVSSDFCAAMDRGGQFWATNCAENRYLVPLCREVCSTITFTDFYWSGVNGFRWQKMSSATAGGKPVYIKFSTLYYRFMYLWYETDHGDPAWVIGYHYNANSYFGWKWGSDLFDYNEDGWRGWQYWSGSEWKQHSPEPRVSCDVSTDAAITISEDSLGEMRLNGTAFGTDTIPPFPDDATSSPFSSIIVGGAIAVVVIMAAIAVVFVRRNKKVVGSAEAHHVAEMSPTDTTNAATADMAAEEECVDEVQGDGPETVVVVEEDAAPKEI